MAEELEKTLENFVSVTAKSQVAVIVPLYGYWSDVKDNPLGSEVLEVVLKRLYSNVHHLIIVFVAHPGSISPDVANILLGRSRAGNSKNIPAGRNDTYAEYVRLGLDYVLDETQSQFVIVFNPWVMIQEGGIDVLVDRANRSDNAKVISGFDLRSVISPESFDTYQVNTPKEEYDLSLNFLGMPRYAAEMLNVDPEYQTHEFLQRDIWQSMFSQGYAVIASQRVPIFPFDFPWNQYETLEAFEADKQHFVQKWKFDPSLKRENA